MRDEETNSGNVFRMDKPPLILLAVLSGVLFGPRPLLGETIPTNHLVMWLDAAQADTVVRDGSNNVQQWLDKSGNGLHTKLQADLAKRPSYNLSGLNFLPTIQFDGVNDVLGFPGSAAITQFTVFAVWDLTTLNSGDDYPLVFQDHDADNYAGGSMFVELGQSAGGTPNNLDIGGAFGSDRRATASNISGIDSFRILSWQAPSTTHSTTVWFNGADTTMSSTGSPANWNFTIGGASPGDVPNEAIGLGGIEWSRAGFADYSNCKFAELLFYDTGAMSTNDRQLVEGILAWKWGLETKLPQNHPWKDINPIPEPSSLVLLAVGWACARLLCRKP
jgi:hypothetical protein